jgi:small subunit ribosomal protein SAe
MSGGLDILAPREDDITKMIKAEMHKCEQNVGFQMKQYVHCRREETGTNILNLHKCWEKIVLAARAIVAIENPADVCIIGSSTFAQRALLKFAHHTGATSVAGRFIPGTFTNQITNKYKEPRLLVICDPHTDSQAIMESSYANIPTIALCNTSSPLKFIDIAIPCNTKSCHAQGLALWMLSREVLRLRGSISRSQPWDVMPDLYFYRDPNEEEVEDVVEEVETAPLEAVGAPSDFTGGEFTADGDVDWGSAGTMPATTVGGFGTAPQQGEFTDNWGS